MANVSTSTRLPLSLRTLLGPFASRPRLVGGFVVGLIVFIASGLVSPNMGTSTRAIGCWDLTCFWFIAFTIGHMRKQTLADLKAHVAANDEGQGLIVAVVLVAAAASLWAVGLELSLAKDAHGLAKDFRVSLAMGTVALSWFTTQLIFALHYAHAYYAPDTTTPEEDDVVGGLAFPGGQDPDNWDFVHFALVIGVASQTADVAFTARRMRRIGSVHSLISFTFNTAVLALTINLLAGLF